MENEKQSGISKLFWNFLPVALTVFLIGVAIKSEWTEDSQSNQGALVFIPIMVPILFPFFKTLSYGIQGIIKAKRLHISQSQGTSDVRMKSLYEKVLKWRNIMFASWIITFLSFISIPIALNITDRSDEGIQLVNMGQPQILSHGSNIHNLLCFFDLTIQYLFLIPIIALVLGVIVLIKSFLGKWWKLDRKIPTGWKKTGYATIAAFFLPIIMIFILSFAIEKIVWREVKTWLENVSDNAIVSINNEVNQKPQTVIDELKKLVAIPAHHSHATKRIRIAIKDNEEGLVIDLGRDSQLPQEYWIFYLGYKYTRVNEIGRITTNLFDNF
jgi:ABC-type multidrug transport system fused ATPase/permease subunit